MLLVPDLVAGLQAAGLSHLASGKVRELFAVPPEVLPPGTPPAVLMVATDRISAFDVVLPTPIPDKGAVLTGLSAWWAQRLSGVVASHLLSARSVDLPAVLAPFADALRGRSVLCRRLAMVPVECVGRAYVAGSALGQHAGLVEGERLPAPLFTPTTKGALGGHDAPLTPAGLVALVGTDLAAELERLTLAVLAEAGRLAAERGLLLADTKLEVGWDGGAAGAGMLRLGDEVLTPDSSRFWPRAQWRPGGPQPSLDKQPVRDWLTAEGLRGEPAALPDAVVAQTQERYIAAYEQITGSSFDTYLRES